MLFVITHRNQWCEMHYWCTGSHRHIPHPLSFIHSHTHTRTHTCTHTHTHTQRRRKIMKGRCVTRPLYDIALLAVTVLTERAACVGLYLTLKRTASENENKTLPFTVL